MMMNYAAVAAESPFEEERMVVWPEVMRWICVRAAAWKDIAVCDTADAVQYFAAAV